MIDWDHAHNLLNIANLARQWPDLKWLHDAAMEELARAKPGPKAQVKTTPVEVPDEPQPEAPSEEVGRRRLDD